MTRMGFLFVCSPSSPPPSGYPGGGDDGIMNRRRQEDWLVDGDRVSGPGEEQRTTGSTPKGRRGYTATMESMLGTLVRMMPSASAFGAL